MKVKQLPQENQIEFYNEGVENFMNFDTFQVEIDKNGKFSTVYLNFTEQND